MTKRTRAAFDTMQFFELAIPAGMTVDQFMETDDFRQRCADLITSGFIDFKHERSFDEDGREVTE